MFGLYPRCACGSQIRRPLENQRRNRTSPGASSRAGLFLLAVLSLPCFRAGEIAVPGQQNPTATAAAPAATNQSGFELRVVGPDGRPIAEALVELRTNPAPTGRPDPPRQVRQTRTYGAFLTADAEGRLVIDLPRIPKSLDVDITTPGYGPYWASWSSESHDEPIPSHFTAELEAGWSVGGIIVDSGREAGRRRDGHSQHRIQETSRRLSPTGRRHATEDRRRRQVALRQRAGLDVAKSTWRSITRASCRSAGRRRQASSVSSAAGNRSPRSSWIAA